jgi:cytidine deaminase
MILKLGLLGTTGVGKDTCVNIIKNHFPQLAISIVRLADPLYEAQEAIYKICKTPKDFHSQDGELLNFLGSHMRKINPEVLKQSFLERMLNIDTNAHCIICPDVRALDVPFVRNAGFTIIHIDTDPIIALERRKIRGDVSLGKTNHATEKGICSMLYDHHLTNNGSISTYEENVKSLIGSLIS